MVGAAHRVNARQIVTSTEAVRFSFICMNSPFRSSARGFMEIIVRALYMGASPLQLSKVTVPERIRREEGQLPISRVTGDAREPQRSSGTGQGCHTCGSRCDGCFGVQPVRIARPELQLRSIL